LFGGTGPRGRGLAESQPGAQQMGRTGARGRGATGWPAMPP